MFARLMRFELKNILRDRMTLMLLFYPLVMGFIGRWLLNSDTFDKMGSEILIIGLTLISGLLFGALAGFSILDDRDDNVFLSIQISPLNIHMYVIFKVAFVYIMSIIAGIFIILMAGGLSMLWWQMLLISALSGLQAPINAFLINAFASNKVEGFVTMKATGFLLIFPIISYFFFDWKEWLFSIAPAFWAAKAVQTILFKEVIEAGFVTMNLSFTAYLLIGFVYNVILVFVMYQVFIKKTDH